MDVKKSKYFPIIFLFLVWFIFAHPFFLKGKVPYASNYQVTHFSPWSAYEEFWGPVKNGAMPDVIGQIYPWRHLAIDIWRTGQVPLWNPYNFSGTPLLANYQSAVLFPLNILFFILPFVDAWSLLILLQPLLAGIFTYLFIRSLKISKAGNIFASISFMFCGFITTWMGYGTLGYAILFLPLSLYSIEKFYQDKKIRFLILLSLTIPLSFFAGHFQISLYFLLFIFAYICYKYISCKDIRSLFYLALFSIFGLLLAFPQILPSIEFYSNSVRSTLFQKVEVIPWSYLATFIAPDFFGNPVTRNDWFGAYAEWNAYVGLLPLLFAVYALLKRKKEVIFFLVTAAVALIFAFDTPFITMLVNLHVPVLSTSAASRIIVIFSFSVAILAGFGFDQIVTDIKENRRKKIIFWLTGFIAIFLILWSIIIFKLFIPEEKIGIARQNLILPTLLFFTTALLIITTLFRKKIILFTICYLLFAISFDMLRFITKWQAFDPKNLVFPKTTLTDYFPNISSSSRSFGNYGAEISAYYKLPSVEGYDPVYNKRYGEFISSLSEGRVKDGERYVVSLSKNGRYTDKAVNLLGIKYIIHKVSDGRAVWAYPHWENPEQYKLIFKDGKYEIYENKNVSPRVYLASGYKVIKERQRIIGTLFSDNFDLAKELILEEDPNIRLKEGKKTARIMNFTPNEVLIKTDSESNSILLLTDSFYPGWKAFIDNIETKIYRADYTFKAIVVPEGEHNVKFAYEPMSFRVGVYAAIIGFIGIVLTGVILNF